MLCEICRDAERVRVKHKPCSRNFEECVTARVCYGCGGVCTHCYPSKTIDHGDGHYRFSLGSQSHNAYASGPIVTYDSVSLGRFENEVYEGWADRIELECGTRPTREEFFSLGGASVWDESSGTSTESDQDGRSRTSTDSGSVSEINLFQMIGPAEAHGPCRCGRDWGP
jgi:hypothetical protein